MMFPTAWTQDGERSSGEVNVEFKMKSPERGEEELGDRWWVEKEEETERLSLRAQLQIDRRRREEFGGRRRSTRLPQPGLSAD